MSGLKRWDEMSPQEKAAALDSEFEYSRRCSEQDVEQRSKKNPLAFLFRKRASYEDKDKRRPRWAR